MRKIQMQNNENTDVLSFDIPDELYEKLQKEANEKGITVEDLVSHILHEAIQSGEFEKVLKQCREESNAES